MILEINYISEVVYMKIGFIGAGKVGFSLSRYLNDKYHNVIGIYSKNDGDAIECAKFSISEYYSNINDLIYDCDTLFLTVNDDSIIDVVNLLIKLNIRNKILIHTFKIYYSFSVDFSYSSKSWAIKLIVVLIFG